MQDLRFIVTDTNRIPITLQQTILHQIQATGSENTQNSTIFKPVSRIKEMEEW